MHNPLPAATHALTTTPLDVQTTYMHHLPPRPPLCRFSDKYPFRMRSETPDIAIELSLQPWRAFRPDGVIFFSDILTPLPAMGIEFDVIKGKGPVIGNPVRGRGDGGGRGGGRLCLGWGWVGRGRAWQGGPEGEVVHEAGTVWNGWAGGFY